MWKQTLSAILGSNFEIYSTYFILKSLAAILKGCVCLSRSATEIVYMLIHVFQVTALDQLLQFWTFGIKNNNGIKQPRKNMSHCRHFKDGAQFEYFTSIFWMQLFYDCLNQLWTSKLSITRKLIDASVKFGRKM
jgi:hypothetical protein